MENSLIDQETFEACFDWLDWERFISRPVKTQRVFLELPWNKKRLEDFLLEDSYNECLAD